MQYQISTEDHGKLSDDLKKEYRETEVDGKKVFRLKLEGDNAPDARLKEFRKTNDDLKKKVDSYGDHTPEKIAELEAAKKKAEEDLQKLKDKDKQKPTEIQQAIDAALEKHNNEVVNPLKQQIKERDEALELKDLTSSLTQQATEKKVLPSAMRDVIGRAQADGILTKKKSGESGEWLDKLSKDAPHLFEQSNGAGGPGGDPSDPKPVTVDPNDASALSKALLDKSFNPKAMQTPTS